MEKIIFPIIDAFTGEIESEWTEPIVVEADTVDSYTITRRYEPGEYMNVDSTMYRVVLPIMPGAFLTPGTNIEETTIQAEIARLNKEEQ